MTNGQSVYLAYYNHFANRLAERYGVILTDNLYRDIVRQIQNKNQVTRVKQVNNQRTIHCVYITGQRAYVLYRKSVKGRVALITALPPRKEYKEMHEEQRRLAKGE